MRAKRAEALGQALFQISLDRAGQHGRGAFGADRDGHWITVHDGGRDELAVLQVVHDINQRAACQRQMRCARVLDGIFICAVKQLCTDRIAVIHCARHKVKLAGVVPLLNLSSWLGSEYTVSSQRISSACAVSP